MAEESGGSSWWGDWGNDFLQNIKAKSSETMAMVKQDLSEFMTTVQGDTTSAIADTATAVKDQLKVNEEDQDSTSGKLKQGMSDWFGTISSTLKDNLSQVANTAAASFAEIDSPVFDRSQARLNEIQTDPTTYCSEPDGHPHLYDEWCKRFDLEQCKGEISELLVNKPKVRALYTNLVPSAVSHSLFWQRYFYKVYQLNQEEEKRAALVERANKVAEEDLGWGDDEDEDLWGTEGSSAGDVVQTFTQHESPGKVVSASHGDAEEGVKTQPIILVKNDIGTENNRAKSGVQDYVDILAHFQESGGNSKSSMTENPSSSNNHLNQSHKRGDEDSLQDMKKLTDKTVCASLSIGTSTAEVESSKVLPINQPKCDSYEVVKQPKQEATETESSKEPKMSLPKCDSYEVVKQPKQEATETESSKEPQMSLPKCDSYEVEKQPKQEATETESSKEPKMSLPKCDSYEVEKQPNLEATETESSKEPKGSPIIQNASQSKCDIPELETSTGPLTRDYVDSSPDEKVIELAIHSQQSLYQRASSTGSGDSSWSKLSEEVNEGKAKPSLSKSSSSSSGVLVPAVDDKDIEWDNDLDLDEDISEEEMKKIMESLGNNDLGKLGDLELEEDEWDSWE